MVIRDFLYHGNFFPPILGPVHTTHNTLVRVIKLDGSISTGTISDGLFKGVCPFSTVINSCCQTKTWRYPGGEFGNSTGIETAHNRR